MLVKLALAACFIASCSAVWNGPLAGGQPASLYPAGVSPQACPNYPNCHNPAVAVQPAAPAWNAGNQWNGGGQWGGNNGQWGGNNGQWGGNNGQWNGNNGQWNGGGDWNHNALDRGDYVGDGDYHGEGLAESGAYGGGQQGQWNQVPTYNPGLGVPAQIPAGVDAHACPNYPFCH